MRFYDIQISDAATGAPFKRYTSFVNGATDPNALRVELDLPFGPLATPIGDTGGHVRIWGISIQDARQQTDFNGKAIKVFGGMQVGLPLATAAFNAGQSGLLVQGVIQQAFANWVGTDMTLELILRADIGSKNIVLNWKKGATLAAALAPTLTTAFPGLTQNITITSALVLPADEVGFYSTLGQFSQHIWQMSRDIVGGNYPGVDIAITGTTINVYDNTNPPAPKMIAFNDLVGQITWIAPQTVQVLTVMRADIAIGDRITLPQSQTTTTEASYSQSRQGSLFQGTLQVNQGRHVGDSRSPDGQSWVTVFNAVQPLQGKGTVAIDDLSIG